MFVRAIGIRTTCVMTPLPALLTGCDVGVTPFDGAFLNQASSDQIAYLDQPRSAEQLTAPGDWRLAARQQRKQPLPSFSGQSPEAHRYSLAKRAV
jgi:hypothetical protein